MRTQPGTPPAHAAPADVQRAPARPNSPSTSRRRCAAIKKAFIRRFPKSPKLVLFPGNLTRRREADTAAVACKGALRDEVLAVSHRWMQQHEADGDGPQLRAVQAFDPSWASQHLNASLVDALAVVKPLRACVPT